MILHGNQRGGAKDLALHLLKSENEQIEVHELRGFVADNLISALNEAHAISRGTRCKQFLFSLSLNPPPGENVSTEAFEDAIEQVEQKLGLDHQPRAIVFHEKAGRRHCHAVWSRIDAQDMKAVQLSFTKRKLMDVSRELFLKHGWTMPRGLMHSGERDPRNFTLAEWQQAKRLGENPKHIKAVFQDCWAVSDTQAAFQQALKERGYTLARGDRRGFVALDYRCEVFAISKWVGIRTKALRSKLSDPDALPSVAEARQKIAQDMAAHLGQLQQQRASAIETRLSEIETKRLALVAQHQSARQALENAQQQRWQAETRLRQARFNKGLRGLLDCVTGKYGQIKQCNEEEAYQARQHDRQEKDELIFQQLEARRALQRRIERLRQFNDQSHQSLSKDRDQYEQIRTQQRETFELLQRRQRQRSLNGPGYER